MEANPRLIIAGTEEHSRVLSFQDRPLLILEHYAVLVLNLVPIPRVNRHMSVLQLLSVFVRFQVGILVEYIVTFHPLFFLLFPSLR